MTINVQGAKPVFLVDDQGNSYSAGGGGGSTSTTNGALDASFQQVTSNGTLAALNATQAITIGRRGTLTMHVTGTWSGQISLQASLDGGTTWVTINQTNTWLRQSTGAYTNVVLVNDIYQTSVLGFTSVRVSMTAYSSGTANVYLVASDESSLVALDAALPAGSALIGGVNTYAGSTALVAKASGTAPATTDASLVVTQSPNYASSAAASITANLAASTNATLVKSSGGTLFQIDASNYSGATVYVKLYNKASAPTVGTDTPVLTIPVATGAVAIYEFGHYGKRFTTGISYAVTTAASDADAGAITSAAATPVKLGVTYL